MNILLVYPPFCTPASPPYSLVQLYWFLRKNCPFNIEILDLNIYFHTLKWKKEGLYFRSFSRNYNSMLYDTVSKRFMKESTLVYAENNKRVIEQKEPELFSGLLQRIIERKPDIVAFSFVYSSQAFYGYALLQRLQEMEIKTVIGGPAVNQKLQEVSLFLNNEVELLEYVLGTKIDHTTLAMVEGIDFSILPLQKYFVPDIVLPLRTSMSCYYKQCTFCTHHENKKYTELPLSVVRETILLSRTKKVFFIDDMITKKRLLELAAILKPLQVSWICQLRPTGDHDSEMLNTLHESGLQVIIWGVESGNQRVLDLMKKGTKVEEMRRVLENSKVVGVKNGVYILFGFPTETKEEFLDTVLFLKNNQQNIDAVLSTIFGLQEGAPIFNAPEKFGITSVMLEQRTILEPKVSYTVSQGLSQREATVLRKRYKKALEKMNRVPAAMNFFREHILFLE